MPFFRHAPCALLPLALLLHACGSSEVAGGGPAPPAGPAPEPTVIELSGDIGIAGDTLYLPFTMPPGVTRLDAQFGTGSPDTKIGIGAFDAYGAEFGGVGFRGISGEERRDFFIEGHDATPGFVAGALSAGEWTIVVPNFLNAGTAHVKVTMSYAPTGMPPPREPAPEVIAESPGWYLGDLHVHTTHSSDAFGSGAALDPAAMARRAQERGLHFISLTDHNVTTQNDRMRGAQPPGFLLLGGEEVTTWQAGPGHLTVSGLQSGDWVDWRFRPVTGVWARTSRWNPAEKPIQAALDHARALGVYSSVAHPAIWPGFGSNWGFFDDAANDPSALPDGFEVWNGSQSFALTWGPMALRQWDQELAKLRHVCGNGGSDVHGVGGDTEVGTPATAVFADRLSRAAVVTALRECRGYMTSGPQGPALLLTAEGPGNQKRLVGGTIHGAPGDAVTVSARVTGGRGATLIWVHNGSGIASVTLDADDQTVTRAVTIGEGGAIRAELRASMLAAEPMALSNPVFLRLGAAPADADESAAIAQAHARLPHAATP